MNDDPAFKFYMKYIDTIKKLYDGQVPLDKQRDFWDDALQELDQLYEDYFE